MMAQNQKKSFAKVRSAALAFFSGAGVMALEMAGMRLLEPYLGNTIYIWGALIAVFMGALAIGYYAGGKLADKFPEFGKLGIIFTVAALWILIVPYAGNFVGKMTIRAFDDPRLQACAASMVLFAVPCVLLGMVTPFLVRLSVNELSGVGGTAGTLYAVSTAGSIAGTFAVSFVLPELIGTMATLWGIGVLLAILATVCFWNRFLHNVLSMLVTSGILSAAFFLMTEAEGQLAAVTNFPYLPAGHKLRKAEQGGNLCFRESAYHNINVFESQLNYDTAQLLRPPFRARYMMFNQQVESGCLLKDGKVIRPIQTTCRYVRFFTCGILVAGKAPRRIAMLGSGGGVGVQLLADDYPDTERIDVVDIDRAVFELAGKYFDYPYPDKSESFIRNHITDGRRFLTKADDKEYDLLIMDVFTSGGRVPQHLVTEEFFRLASTKISGKGTLTINLIGNINSPDERFLPAVIKTLQKVFRHVYIFPRDRNRRANVMIVCSNDLCKKLTKNELLQRFDEGYGRLFKQNIRKIIENYTEQNTKKRDIPVLTDDFCPADALATL